MGNLPRAAGAGKATGNLWLRCMEATESTVNAAILLMRILFWMPKARIRRGGYTWIARSAAEWAADEMKRSIHQYKRAAACLRQLGLIVTEQHQFGGKSVTFTRLTERGMTLLPAKQCRTALPGPTAAQPAKRNGAPPHIQRDTYRERQEGKNCVLSHASAPGEDSGQEDSGEKSKNKTQSQYDLVGSATPSKSEPENTSAGSTKPDSVPALENLWDHVVAEVHGGFVPHWTSKERGQMRQFREACPPGAALAVLEACLRDWACS